MIKFGKRRCNIRTQADDSKLESDINEANKKVEKAVEKSADKTVKIEEQKTAKLKEESDKNVKNAEQATEKIADAWIDAGKDAEKAMDIDIKEKGITVDVKLILPMLKIRSRE